MDTFPSTGTNYLISVYPTVTIVINDIAKLFRKTVLSFVYVWTKSNVLGAMVASGFEHPYDRDELPRGPHLCLCYDYLEPY